MKRIILYCLAAALILAAGMPATVHAGSSGSAGIEAALHRRINQARADVWREVQTHGYNPAQVREQGGAQTVAALDGGLPPLVAVPGLARMAADLNANCLAAGRFTRLRDASADPNRVIIGEARYPARKAGARYAVVSYQAVEDAGRVALQLLEELLAQDISLLAAGAPAVLFDPSLKEMGVSLSGGQEMVNGRAYYTYVLTVLAVTPEAVTSWSHGGVAAGADNVFAAKALFDPQYYLLANPDLAETIGYDSEALLAHWLQFGLLEGRTASRVFDAPYYLLANPDLSVAMGQDFPAAMRHWLAFGIHEGRTAASGFDPKTYLAVYPDLAAAFGDNYEAAVWHYLLLGFDEGR